MSRQHGCLTGGCTSLRIGHLKKFVPISQCNNTRAKGGWLVGSNDEDSQANHCFQVHPFPSLVCNAITQELFYRATGCYCVNWGVTTE